MTKYNMTSIRYLEKLHLSKLRIWFREKRFRHDFQGWGVLEMLELRIVSKQSRTIPNSEFFKL